MKTCKLGAQKDYRYSYHLHVKDNGKMYYRVIPKAKYAKEIRLEKKEDFHSTLKKIFWPILTTVTIIMVAISSLPVTETNAEIIVEPIVIEETQVNNAVAEEFQYNGVCAEYYDLVAQYDWDTNIALAIMKAESGCNPNADNTGLNYDGSYDLGLMQVNSIHGYNDNDLFNPEFNVQVAYKIYQNRMSWDSCGWNAWSTYNNGSYLKYL